MNATELHHVDLARKAQGRFTVSLRFQARSRGTADGFRSSSETGGPMTSWSRVHSAQGAVASASVDFHLLGALLLGSIPGIILRSRLSTTASRVCTRDAVAMMLAAARDPAHPAKLSSKIWSPQHPEFQAEPSIFPRNQDTVRLSLRSIVQTR